MTVATMGVHATVVLGLASAAWLATRRCGRCELGHVLWCAALLGLLVPPLFEVPVLPSVQPAAAWQGPTIVSGVEALEITPGRLETGPRQNQGPSVGLVEAAGVVWSIGFLVVALGTFAAAWSFRRRLREADLPEADLMSTVRRTAAELGLRSLPRVRVLDAPVSPAIWPLPSTLVLPRQLLAELSPAELRAVLLHELTHYARRDHWIRLLEAVVLAVWWWLPLAWWFRAELRFAEEASCDQRVLSHLRGGESPALYAEALIKTVALMARGTGATMPGLATGAGGPRSMTWRIQRIMSDRSLAPLSVWTRAACLLGSAALLTLAPIPAHVESSAPLDRLQDPVREETPPELPDEVAPVDLDELTRPQDPKRLAEDKLLRGAVELLKADRYEEALELLQPPATARARTGQLDMVRAMALMHLGRRDEAVQALRTASEKSPRDPQVWRLLGSLELQLDRPERAVEALQEAASLAPESAQIFGLLGIALQSAGDLRGSHAALEKAVTLAPGDTQWIRALAGVHAANSDFGPAADLLRQAIELEPEDRALHENLIKILASQGRYEEAAAAQRRLAEVGAPEVERPAAVESREADLLLAVTREGKVIHQGRELSIGAIESLLRAWRNKHPDQALEVLLQADVELAAGRLVQVVDACKLGGATKVSLATIAPPPKEEPPGELPPPPPPEEEPLEEPEDAGSPPVGDQRPRVTYQPAPVVTEALRARGPGKVVVLLVVDGEGRVKNPEVQSSTDPAFEKPALDAVRRWRFEPGLREGKPASFRMRVPLTFPGALPVETRPRAIHRANPVLSAAARRKTPGKVVLNFVVDAEGRVGGVQVESSTDELLEQPAIEALRKWRFEPATRDGEPVVTEMRIPITFPAVGSGGDR